MGVEGRDLVDFGERKLHLLRQRGKMRGRKMAVVVLDQMQMLDQQIAAALALAKQRADLFERLRIDLAALRRARRPAPAGLPPRLGGVMSAGGSVRFISLSKRDGHRGLQSNPFPIMLIENFY